MIGTKTSWAVHVALHPTENITLGHAEIVHIFRKYQRMEAALLEARRHFPAKAEWRKWHRLVDDALSFDPLNDLWTM
jgi:hypothetical protein